NDRIDNEASIRAEADEALNDRIDTEEDIREAADKALNTRIDDEEAVRAEADKALNDRIDNEASIRETADKALSDRIDKEVSDLEAADDALSKRIDEEEAIRKATDDALNTRIDDEAKLRETVDNALNDRIDSEETIRETADNALNTRIDNEEDIREAADKALNDRIDNEEAIREAADKAEADARKAADDAEAKARQEADSALSDRIDSEEKARQDADKALDDKIVAETNERVKADTALNERIDREQTERVNADTALNTRIDQEIIDRQNNDIVAGAIDREKGTVTLTKGNGDPITLDGNLCDSRLDNVTYDEDEGKLTFTVTDHYNQDDKKTIEVDGIASEKALEKETSERQAMDEAIINDYNQKTDALGGQINSLGHRMTKAVAGAAALAALHPLDFDPDDKLSFSAGVGNYGGSTAAAIGAFYRPNERVMFSIGGTVGNGEEMVNAGVSFALGKGGKVNTSRVAMTHEINDLRQQVAYLSAVVAQLASQNGYQFTDMKPFPDTAENHWAYEYVAKLAAEGIVEGYPSGNFDGDRTMTRYEFAAMLFHALEKGITLDTRVINEFEPELGRLSVERIKG
ncbi:MAG: S-layer homology domain-containing protein, partial [Selenomonadales bacterium]|nr:S-layer homology domain-containing protein [Selenomonadales bacterium]